ncbi:MAG: hypothetical protein U0T77_10855 [Chitinophagales bacterium]
METIFKVIVPGWTGKGLPKEFPWHVRFALRASVLVAHIFALLNYGLPFNWINSEKKYAVINKLYCHSNPNIRNIFELWKTMAFMTQC